MRSKVFIALLFVALSAQAQQLRLMEWNVENLFHPSCDSLHQDQDFTPDGDYRWTYGRFYRKMGALAQVIAGSCDVAPRQSPNLFPDLIALCEVEADSALVALTRYSVLRTLNYRYLCTHGSDSRGVNVALLYDQFAFTPLSWHEVVVPSVQNGFPPTRNLLYVSGAFNDGLDTLHVVVCHLPSKASGTSIADKNRLLAAQTLLGVVDSVMTVNPSAKVVVAGDCNSTPRSRVMRMLTSRHLRMLASDFVGTYRFDGLWDHLDYVLCTPSVKADTAHVVRLPFMMEENKTYGGEQPFRTYRGKYYHGGISDHLPLVVNISAN